MIKYIILLIIIIITFVILTKQTDEEYDEITYVKKHKKVKEDKLNTYFNNVQFHNDYRDIITTLTFLSTQKQMFNLGNRAVHKIDVSETEIKNIINEMIDLINERNKTLPSTFNINIGWNNVLPEKSSLVKSGWDKQQENLGLPKSLYSDMSGKRDIKLIQITEYDKFETTKEIRYSITCIIQKQDVADQMVLHLLLTKEKQKNELYIEEFLVNGFLTNYYTGATLPLHMQPVSHTGEASNITSDKSIMDILENRLDYTENMMADFTNNLDTDTKQFVQSMPTERSL